MRSTSQVKGGKVRAPQPAPCPNGQPVVVPMDPRFRRRRIEVRRDEGRRRLRVLMIGVLILTSSVGAWVAVRSPLFDVDRVQVEGIEHTPAATIVRQAAVHGGQAMVDVDEAGAARRVETLPWVAHATVRRRWPATVRITVTERRAMAVTRADGAPAAPAPAAPAPPAAPTAWALLDASGRVLELAPAAPPGLTVLEGLGAAAPPGAQQADASGLLAVVAAMSPPLRARTAAVVAAGGGLVEVKLNPRGVVRLGPPEDLKAKLAAVETVLAQVNTVNLATLDVRLPSSPVLTRG